ncbi:hypothetical protein LTR78_003095 [Recurvomyces mirabilis]|uniref:Flavin-nucleotide-binding protein n=1 Tax=Recurvomyces mirabilis TaxID=574656 RepID=A0AAE0WSB7_9PEZI|nr:hypothetical protein LTR78_003095 [Recurvomyces mirabilis]KAK5157083.1 hypothetical protein LTS14_004601 [Recurvomyces mirabilis]
MAPSAAYKPDERSKGVRLAKRTHYDTGLVHNIVNTCSILHVSFNAPAIHNEPQFPTILPMLGAIARYSTDDIASLYLHGSSVARLFKLTEGGTQELPMCVAATHIDGYVLALAPFHNSCNYRSAVCFGHGSLVTSPEEILFALELITNNSVPERWENSRSAPTKAELTSTAILKMTIETASAKVRTGGPSDDRADSQDRELVGRTWTGVVPTYTVLGAPVESDYNQVKAVPEYLDDWVADANSMAEQRAVDAVDPPPADDGVEG